MAFIKGGSNLVLVGGNNLTAYLNNASISMDAGLQEKTVFSEANRNYQQGSPKTANITLSGFFDAATDGSEEILRDIQGLSDTFDTTFGYAPITIAYEGSTNGSKAFVGTVLMSNYEIGTEVGSLMPIAGSFTCGGARKTTDISGTPAPTTGEQAGFGSGGILLAAPATPTVAVFGTSFHDNGASSSNGAILNLHCTVASAGATTILIEHATASGGPYATLATFTTFNNNKEGQSLVIGKYNAAGTTLQTINRYVRARCTAVTGSPIFAVSYVRL